MGMFDTIRFHGDEAPRCPAGHRLADLQTKDLESTLAVYSVLEGRLYRPGREHAESVALDDRGRLILTDTKIAEPASISVSLAAYGFCAECRPVLYLGEGGLHRDHVQERRGKERGQATFRRPRF